MSSTTGPTYHNIEDARGETGAATAVISITRPSVETEVCADAVVTHPLTVAETIRSAGIRQRSGTIRVPSADDGTATLSERMRSDGICERAVAAVEPNSGGTDAERYRAAGMRQPVRVAAIPDSDNGCTSMAERIRSDGIAGRLAAGG